MVYYLLYEGLSSLNFLKCARERPRRQAFGDVGEAVQASEAEAVQNYW